MGQREIRDESLMRRVPSLELPVYVPMGRHDRTTPGELVEAWLAKPEAPHKELVWFERSAHSPNLEEAHHFQQVLITRLLGLACGGTDG